MLEWMRRECPAGICYLQMLGWMQRGRTKFWNVQPRDATSRCWCGRCKRTGHLIKCRTELRNMPPPDVGVDAKGQDIVMENSAEIAPWLPLEDARLAGLCMRYTWLAYVCMRPPRPRFWSFTEDRERAKVSRGFLQVVIVILV